MAHRKISVGYLPVTWAAYIMDPWCHSSQGSFIYESHQREPPEGLADLGLPIWRHHVLRGSCWVPNLTSIRIEPHEELPLWEPDDETFYRMLVIPPSRTIASFTSVSFFALSYKEPLGGKRMRLQLEHADSRIMFYKRPSSIFSPWPRNQFECGASSHFFRCFHTISSWHLGLHHRPISAIWIEPRPQ